MTSNVVFLNKYDMSFYYYYFVSETSVEKATFIHLTISHKSPWTQTRSISRTKCFRPRNLSGRPLGWKAEGTKQQNSNHDKTEEIPPLNDRAGTSAVDKRQICPTENSETAQAEEGDQQISCKSTIPLRKTKRQRSSRGGQLVWCVGGVR